MRELKAAPTRLALPSAANSSPRSRPSSGYNPGPIHGVPPRPDLTIEHLPETAPPPHAEKRSGSEASADHVSQEKRASYSARATESAAKMEPESREAIRSFTGSGYTSIRQSEESGKPNAQSDAIQKAFQTVRPEPGTVYRGVNNVDRATAEKWIRWNIAKDGPFRLGRGNTGATSSSAWHPAIAAQSFMGGHQGTSWTPNTVKVFFKIQQHSGIPIESVSAYGGAETEVLLSRSAEFNVSRVARWEGSPHVVVIELNEIQKPTE